MATTATKTMATPHTVGLLVVSTTAAKDAASDSSARLLRDLFASETTAAGGKPGKPTWAVTKIRIVSDDYDEIQTSVRKWADVDHLHLIVTTGGTGFAASDITPEVRTPTHTLSTPSCCAEKGDRPSGRCWTRRRPGWCTHVPSLHSPTG